MTPENLSRLTAILEMDFDDLTSGDMQFLRNRIRESYHIDPTIHLDKNKCHTAFCLFKRKYISRPEMLLVQPKMVNKDGGTFGVNFSGRVVPILPHWDGFNMDHKGAFPIPIGYYPVISVHYTSGLTKVICMNPKNGFFFEIDSSRFDFEI